jgi:hypothetical protein
LIACREGPRASGSAARRSDWPRRHRYARGVRLVLKANRCSVPNPRSTAVNAYRLRRVSPAQKSREAASAISVTVSASRTRLWARPSDDRPMAVSPSNTLIRKATNAGASPTSNVTTTNARPAKSTAGSETAASSSRGTLAGANAFRRPSSACASRNPPRAPPALTTAASMASYQEPAMREIPRKCARCSVPAICASTDREQGVPFPTPLRSPAAPAYWTWIQARDGTNTGTEHAYLAPRKAVNRATPGA